jgi:hypothetical protein
MRFRILLAGFSLVAASTLCAAHAQDAVVPDPTTKAPAGLTFNYDPLHGGLSASSLTVKPLVENPTASLTYNGKVEVDLIIRLVSTDYPPNTVIKCSALLFGGNLQYLEGGVVTANATPLTATPEAAQCVLSLPYSWAFPSTNGGLSLSFVYAAAATTPEGTVVRSFTTIGDTVAMLPNNSTRSFIVNGAL